MAVIEYLLSLPFPAELIILVVAMLPIVEVRGALPLALGVYHLPFWSAALFSVIGNMIPVFFILIIFEKILMLSQKHWTHLHRLLDWLYRHIEKKHIARYELLGSLFLMSFVALPIPFTGAWTGALAAIVFKIPFKKAILSIFVGVLIATGIMYVITRGILLF